MNDLTLPVPVDQLEELSVKVARGDHPLAREALQRVRVQFWKGLYDPARGSFVVWAKIVMKGYCLDAWADRRRSGGHDAAAHVADPSDRLAAAAFALDIEVPFGTADLTAIRRWSARQRVVLLWWLGLWEKLPVADRREALAAIGVPGAAPPPGFETWPATDRITHLVALLGCGRNDVSQICCRDMRKVADLAFIRWMRTR